MKIKRPLESVKNVPLPTTDGIDYPIFCFKHLQWKNIKKTDAALFKLFIERMQKLENLGWEQIYKSDRHSFGFEYLPVRLIKPKLPSFISPDIKSLLVFRYTGDNLPFLALRSGNILHVIFIETRFGDIYNH